MTDYTAELAAIDAAFSTWKAARLSEDDAANAYWAMVDALGTKIGRAASDTAQIVAAINAIPVFPPPAPIDVAALAAAIAAALPQPAPAPPGPVTPPVWTPPALLQMPDGATGPISLGDTTLPAIELYVSNDVHITTNTQFCVMVNDQAITAALTCSSFGGVNIGNSQHFTIHTTLPGPTPKISIAPAGDHPYAAFWIDGARVNGSVWYFTGDPDGHGTQTETNGCFLTGGRIASFYAKAASASGGSTGGTPTPAAPNMLAPLFASPAPTVALPAGILTGSTHVLAPVTLIAGGGIDVTIADGTGTEPAGDKALFHTNTTDTVTFQDFTIKNAANPASMGPANANAAAIKPELETMSINCSRMKFTGNQNGLLCSGLSGSDCTFDDNGCGQPGQTHEIYVRGLLPLDITNYTFLSTTDANHGQTIQSRSPLNRLTNVNAACSLNGGGFNFPDCGYVEINGGSITKKAGTADHKLLSIGNGSAKNKTAFQGNVVNVTNWHIDAAAIGGGIIHFGPNAADYVGSISATYTGDIPPKVEGLTNPSSVTVAFTKVG